MPRPSRSLRRLAGLVLLAAVVAWLRWNGWLTDDALRTTDRRPAPAESRGNQHPPADLPPASKQWTELAGCTLVPDRLNDGDSFVVDSGGRQYTIRLYFADCPEKYRHRYNGDRLAEQGRYFGGLAEADTIRIGERARDFTRDLLERRPFAVRTRWERVYDSDRIYAFVESSRGDLAELLVSEGLARIHTKGESPAGSSKRAEDARLRDLERTAKAAGKGAWGVRHAAAR